MFVAATLCAVMIVPADDRSGDGAYPTDLEKWIATAPPERFSRRWGLANHSTYEWAVSLRDGHPQANLVKPAKRPANDLPFAITQGNARDGLAGKQHVARVDDGWIVAFNAGEFGAGLWWFSPDGTARKKLGEVWVNDLISTEDELCAIAGLAHLSINRGQLLHLRKDREGAWQAEEILDLQHNPEVAILQDDGSLLIATTDRLLRVVPLTKKVDVLVDKAFWSGLYTNSMAVTPAGVIYLGMRQGVARIQMKNDSYKVEWMLPNQEFVESESVRQPETFR